MAMPWLLGTSSISPAPANTLMEVPFLKDRVLSTGEQGAGKLLPQTPKLPPQNLVTGSLRHRRDFFGLNCIKSDLKIRNFLGGGSLIPRPLPHWERGWGGGGGGGYSLTMCTSVVSYCIKMLPSKKKNVSR